MNINVTFSESNHELYTEFAEQDGSFGVGFDGVKTIHGEDGASAYEIALEHGFEGSEEEWLDSLHGEKGDPGYTPQKNVDYFDGKNGYTPVKGVDYFDGEDGISPTVEVSKSGKVTTITITDANGTKTATINDGEDGEGGGGAVSSVNGMVGDVVIESDVFYAVYGTTTTAELEAALTAGKAVYCKNGAYVARFLRKNAAATRHVFGYRDTEYLCDSDTWSTAVVKFSPATHAETHAANGSDPITPAAIGAVSKNGDTMTDRLRIANDGGLQLEYDDSGSGVFIHGSYNDGEPWVELLGSEGDEPVQLSGVADPVGTHDAANKQYVDEAVANAGGGGNISFAEEIPAPSDMEDGELRIVKEADGEVYEILEYIESTAGDNQYFDTGFYPDQDTKVVMDVQQTGVNTADTNQGFFGARTASTKMFAAAWHRTNAAYYVFYNGANANAASAQITERMTVTMDKNVLTVGDSITVSGTYAAFQCEYPLFLFAFNVSGAADYFGVERVFSTQIYNGSGELVRDYEPRRRVSDGLVGLYDKVYGTFGGSGAGTFTAGPVVGTQTEQADAKAYYKKDNVLYMLSDPVARAMASPWVLLAEYATAGSYTFTVPDDVDELGVLVLGGGGSGGAVYGSDSYYAAATGGGSGQIVHEIMKKADGDFAAGEAIAVVVGAGGAAITASASLTNGKNGGSSSFGKITADGGNGGKGYKNTSNSASASASGGSGQSSDYASAYHATYSDNLTIDAPVGMVAYISDFDSDKNPIYISKRDVASARGAINIFDNTDTHIYCGAGASVTKWATEVDTNHYAQSVVSRTKGRAGTGKVSPTAAAVGGNATAPGDGGGAACGAASGTKSGAGAAGLVLVYGRRTS